MAILESPWEMHSTNMPGIGSLIREIDIKISEMWEGKHIFVQ